MSPKPERRAVLPVLTKVHEEHPVVAAAAGDHLATATPYPADSPTQVPRGQVALNPVNPRHAFRSLSALMKILPTLPLPDLETMKDETGQMYPCIVVRRKAFLEIYAEHEDSIGDCLYVVLDGSRRRAAAEKFDLPTLKITIDDERAKDRISFRRDSAIANLGRAELNPYEEMLVLQNLAEETKRSWTEVGRELGMTKSWVSQRRGLSRLEPRMIAALTGETTPKLSFDVARRLAVLDPDDQWETWQAELQNAAAPTASAGKPGFTAVNPSPDSESNAPDSRQPERAETVTEPRKAGRPVRKVTFMKDAEPAVIASTLLEHLGEEKLRLVLASLDLQS